MVLESLRQLDEEIFVPGHGALCGKSYLDEQGYFILEWKEYVQAAIDQGKEHQDREAVRPRARHRYLHPRPGWQRHRALLRNAPRRVRPRRGRLHDWRY